jgi:hypothetical protein
MPGMAMVMAAVVGILVAMATVVAMATPEETPAEQMLQLAPEARISPHILTPHLPIQTIRELQLPKWERARLPQNWAH